MPKQYIVERDENSEIVNTVRITETKPVITEVNILDLIREKTINLKHIEQITQRNAEITAILREIDENTEISIPEMAQEPNILE